MQYSFKQTVSAIKWDKTNFMDIYNLTAKYDLQGHLNYVADTKVLFVSNDHVEEGEYVVVWPTLPDTVQVVVYDASSFEHQFGKVH